MTTCNPRMLPPSFVSEDPSVVWKLYTSGILDCFVDAANNVDTENFDENKTVLSIAGGNSKLGDEIWSFNTLPVVTCPHASTACMDSCYAMKFLRLRKNVREMYYRNYELSKRDDFEDIVIGNIMSKDVSIVRLHTSGDFYSFEYAQKWLNISKVCSGVKFYTYTRSWVDPEMLHVFKAMARRKDWSLWFSTDNEMGKPPVVSGIRTAFMMRDDEDLPQFKGTDLIFRVKRNTVLKSVDGIPVCVNERGLPKTKTCSTCRICVDNRSK